MQDRLESLMAAQNKASKSLATTPLRLRAAPIISHLPTKERMFSGIHPHLKTFLSELIRGDRTWPLLLTGSVGTGKTCAALCVTDVVRSAIYLTVETLLSRVMDRDDDVFGDIRDHELLILDEIGCRNKVTDLESSAVAFTIDQREGTAGSRAIYITNHDSEGLARLYDDRLVSRLLSGSVYQLNGRDRRTL